MNLKPLFDRVILSPEKSAEKSQDAATECGNGTASKTLSFESFAI